MPDDSNSNAIDVAQFFAEVEATMKLKVRGWEKDLPHQGEKGGIRERRVADFLSSILPQKYGIGTGHIISPKEPFISYQTDIVIYDALNGIALPVDDYYSLFPCECVYAAIEVKSELNASDGEKGPSGSIYECVESITRLKALHTLHSIVFAYEMEWKNAGKVIEWFNKFGKKPDKRLPEMVFVLEPGFVLTKDPNLTGYKEESESTRIYESTPLLYFVSNLIYHLSRIEVSTPRLWLDYKKWQPGDLMFTVFRNTQ